MFDLDFASVEIKGSLCETAVETNRMIIFKPNVKNGNCILVI